MTINLEGLSARELQALIAKANQRKKTLSKRKPIAAVRKKVVSLARAEGYSIDELFGTARMVREQAGAAAKKAPAKKSAQKGVKVAPKYRHPDELAAWMKRDPIPVYRAKLVKRGLLTEKKADAVVTTARDEAKAAATRAAAAPWPATGRDMVAVTFA